MRNLPITMAILTGSTGIVGAIMLVSRSSHVEGMFVILIAILFALITIFGAIWTDSKVNK